MRLPLAPTLAAALLPAARLAAQPASPDTLPFHRGQWGVEGTVSGGSLGTGLLRLLSRSTALALNVSANVSSNTMRTQLFSGGVPSGTSEQTLTQTAVSTTLGVRRYRALRDGVAAFTAFGAIASYSRARSEDAQSGSSSSQRQWSAGAFADLGATVFATPRIGLSAVYGLSVQRTAIRVTPGQTGGVTFPPPRGSGWSVGTGGVRLNAALFF
jgi:hypothetical protein